MAEQMIEGTWEEVSLHAQELKLNGRQVKLIVTAPPTMSTTQSMRGMPTRISGSRSALKLV